MYVGKCTLCGTRCALLWSDDMYSRYCVEIDATERSDWGSLEDVTIRGNVVLCRLCARVLTENGLDALIERDVDSDRGFDIHTIEVTAADPTANGDVRWLFTDWMFDRRHKPAAVAIMRELHNDNESLFSRLPDELMGIIMGML